MVRSHAHFDIIDFTTTTFQRASSRLPCRQLRQTSEPAGKRLHARCRTRPFAEGHPRGHLGACVVNIPAQLIADADGRVPHETIMAMNDDLAGLVARHPGRIHGLASVDAYDGDRSAVRLSAPSATLDCAVSSSTAHAAISSSMHRRRAPHWRLRLSSACRSSCIRWPRNRSRDRWLPMGSSGPVRRGTANSASLIALVEGGVLSNYPAWCRRDGACVWRPGNGRGLSARVLLPSGAIDVMRNMSSSTRCASTPR